MPVAEITGTTVRYLHVEQAGSVRTVTNTSGTVAATATWGAYGARLAASGTPSRLGWQGQYTDPDASLVYLRARYYDPNTATFITPDPTHTPYTYGNNDPWNLTDPSGVSWIGNAWDATGGRVVSGTANFIDDPGGLFNVIAMP